MCEFIEEVLARFHSVIRGDKAFACFIILVCGIMLRTDYLGITSIVRALALRPEVYNALVHFCHASSWDLTLIRHCWWETIAKCMPLYQECGMYIFIADGVKQAKEGRRIPGVKRLHQESETQSKAEYIFGHMLGCVGVLIGKAGVLFCLAASLRLHDGLQECAAWAGGQACWALSHVVQLFMDCSDVAQRIGGAAIVVMDRYFLTTPGLLMLQQLNKARTVHLDVIIQAKKNCIAYDLPPAREPGQRGRPRQKGDKVQVAALFQTHRDAFIPAKVELYGKIHALRYYCINLLWGKGLYQELRFVLVQMSDGRESIFACTKLDLDPLTIIRFYSYRFKIENCFRELKQVFAGLKYRFWSKFMPKLNHYSKTTDPTPLSFVTDLREREGILKTIRSNEIYILLACIAMGITQAISIFFDTEGLRGKLRFQRTAPKKISEANVVDYLRSHFQLFLANAPQDSILHLIRERQIAPLNHMGNWVS